LKIKKSQTLFFEELKKSEIEIKNCNSFLNFVRKISFKFSNQFPQLSGNSKEFSEFSRASRNLAIGEYKIPKSIEQFSQISNFPFKSRIFVNYIFREAANHKGNFQQCLDSANKLLTSSLEKIVDLKGKAPKMQELKFFVERIESDSVISSEIQVLTNSYKTEFDKSPQLSQNLSNIFKVFVSFNSSKQLLKYLEDSSPALEIPKSLFEEFLPSESQQYNEFAQAVKKIEQLLGTYNRDQIDYLTLFFSQTAKSLELIVFVYSLELDEINFWRESFDESLDNKQISLTLISTFSCVWNFFNSIKLASSSLSSYFNEITKLLKNKKYSSIVEYIAECNLKVNALDEFNKSLNNQEQVKLNKIKLICQYSKLRILCNETYSAELETGKPDDGANIVPIQLDDLTELRDRALLSKYIIDQRKEQSQVDRSNDLIIYDKFVHFVQEVCVCINILNELRNSLFRDLINKESEFLIIDGNYDSLQRYCDEHKNELNQVEEKLQRNLQKKLFHQLSQRGHDLFD